MSSPQLELDFRPIGPVPPLGFCCGRPEQDDFIHNLACTYNEIGASKTYLAMEGEECVGFVTLASDSIELNGRERPDGVNLTKLPALKIGQLGVDKRAQRRGVAKELVSFSWLKARETRSQIGCVYLSVDAKPDVVGFYEKLGFKRNKAEIKRRRDREGAKYSDATPISMRFDIREPGEVGASVGAATGAAR